MTLSCSLWRAKAVSVLRCWPWDLWMQNRSPADRCVTCHTAGRVFHCETPAAAQDGQSRARNGSSGASKRGAACTGSKQREARWEQLHKPSRLVLSQRWFCRLQSRSLLGAFLLPRDGGSPLPARPAPREWSGQVARCRVCVCLCASPLSEQPEQRRAPRGRPRILPAQRRSAHPSLGPPPPALGTSRG